MAGSNENDFVVNIPVSGALTVANGALKHPIAFPAELVDVFVACGTGPVGSVATFRVNKNGSSAVTLSVADGATAASKAETPGVSPGANVPGGSVPNTLPLATFAAGDTASVDVTAIGSGTAGANAVVCLAFSRI